MFRLSRAFNKNKNNNNETQYHNCTLIGIQISFENVTVSIGYFHYFETR